MRFQRGAYLAGFDALPNFRARSAAGKGQTVSLPNLSMATKGGIAAAPLGSRI